MCSESSELSAGLDASTAHMLQAACAAQPAASVPEGTLPSSPRLSLTPADPAPCSSSSIR